ncbi:MAG: tripartite tricarboxylate transporter substrate-binding protein [Pseudomonadota bacterium]
MPVHSVGELIALARARPGTLAFASSGVGVPSHMAGEMLKWMAHIDLTHVPYKGQGPATADVVAGQVPMMFTSPLNALSFIKDGRLRALAISTAERSEAAPDIPTVAESGLPGFDVGIWFGIQAPVATPGRDRAPDRHRDSPHPGAAGHACQPGCAGRGADLRGPRDLRCARAPRHREMDRGHQGRRLARRSDGGRGAAPLIPRLNCLQLDCAR